MREMGKVRLNWHRCLESVKEPNLVEEKPLPGQGNILFGDFQWEQEQPAGYYWAHTLCPTSDLLHWKSSNPSYRDDPAKMTDLVLSVFAVHYPNLADTQALNSLLMGNERRLVLDKANEEAWRLHQKSPDGALGPPRATPLT